MATKATNFLLVCSLCLMLIATVLSPVSSCNTCIHQYTLAYYAYSRAHNVGACAWGSFAVKLYGGNVGAASSDLYRNGVGRSILGALAYLQLGQFEMYYKTTIIAFRVLKWLK